LVHGYDHGTGSGFDSRWVRRRAETAGYSQTDEAKEQRCCDFHGFTPASDASRILPKDFL
jgi:hypothetical protein